MTALHLLHGMVLTEAKKRFFASFYSMVQYGMATFAPKPPVGIYLILDLLCGVALKANKDLPPQLTEHIQFGTLAILKLRIVPDGNNRIGILLTTEQDFIVSQKKRRGRPRRRPEAADLGTPELRVKRRLISESDPTMATNPLDALLARNLINVEQHTAAVHFRACRFLKFGQPHPKAVNLLRTSGGDGLRDTTKAEAGYAKACAMLCRLSHHHLDVAENLIVHEVWPTWVTQPGRKRAYAACMEAFDVLVRWDRRYGEDALIMEAAQ